MWAWTMDRYRTVTLANRNNKATWGNIDLSWNSSGYQGELRAEEATGQRPSVLRSRRSSMIPYTDDIRLSRIAYDGH